MAVKVYAFGPDLGLPTTGPFAIKLVGWLELARIPYTLCVQNDSNKGPRNKSPWAEIDGTVVADSQRIIDLLAERTGFDIDAGFSPAQRAEGRMWRRAFEEGFHQVLEWELFAHPAARPYVDDMVAAEAPRLVAPVVAGVLRRHFIRQLHARGIARYSAGEIAAMGKADLDALAERVKQSPYLLGDRPSLADLSVYGQVAPMVLWPMHTPVADHAKSLQAVTDYAARMYAACGFGQKALAAE